MKPSRALWLPLALFLASAVSLSGSAQAPFWTLRELARIDGTSEAESNHFIRVRTIAVSSAGNVFVPILGNATEVRMFDAGGKYVASIGRPGAGPGEFRWPQRLGVFGDTLYVIDMGLRRISFFSSSGAFLTSFNYASQAAQAVGFDMPAAVTRGGVAIAVAEVWPRTPPGSRVSLPIIRTNYEGRTLDTIAAVSAADPLIRAPFSGTTLYAWQPVDDSPLISVSKDGSKVVIVTRAFAGQGRPTYGVTLLNEGTKAFSVDIPYQPREYSRASHDSIVDAFMNVPPKAHKRGRPRAGSLPPPLATARHQRSRRSERRPVD